jgi:WD40 repeat protein
MTKFLTRESFKLHCVLGRIAAIAIGIGTLTFSPLSSSFATSPPYAMVTALALSPDGQVVAVSTKAWRGDRIKVWNVQQHFSYPGVPDAQADHLGFSSDGQFLNAVTDREVGLWELSTGKRQHSEPSGADHFNLSVVSPDWQQLAQVAGPYFGKPPYELEVKRAGKVLWRVPAVEPGSALAFSPDGQRLVCVGSIRLSSELPATWSKEMVLRIFDARTGNVLQSIPVGDKKALEVSFTGAGKQVAVVFADGRVTLLDADIAREVKTFIIPARPTTEDTEPNWIGEFYFSQDGETLVSLKRDIQLWDVRQGTLQTTLKPPGYPWIAKTAFSADKKTFAVGVNVQDTPYGAGQPSVYVWNVESGQLIATFF